MLPQEAFLQDVVSHCDVIPESCWAMPHGARCVILYLPYGTRLTATSWVVPQWDKDTSMGDAIGPLPGAASLQEAGEHALTSRAS